MIRGGIGVNQPAGWHTEFGDSIGVKSVHGVGTPNLAHEFRIVDERIAVVLEEKLDLQIITQEEYDAKKAELMKKIK